MQIAHELLRSFRIPGVVLNVNSIGDDSDRPAYREALLAHFRPHKETLSDDSQRRLERNPMRILDSKAPQDQEAIATAPTFLGLLSKANRAHFERVCELLEAIGIAYNVDPRLVRGFDYYTGTVFQYDSDALGAQSTVCGGGRYDDLVRSLGGPPTPGVGFGLGLERFLMILEKAGLAGVAEREGIATIALGEKARAYLFPIAAALRSAEGGNAGVPVYADYADAKIAAQFKRADRLLARAAVIAGEDEVAAGTVVVRDLIARSQETLGPFAGPHLAAREIVSWYGGLPPAGDRISEAM